MRRIGGFFVRAFFVLGAVALGAGAISAGLKEDWFGFVLCLALLAGYPIVVRVAIHGWPES